MKEPYITKSSTSITANNTAEAVNAHACIYQNTQDTCNFSVGGNGLTQLEFDYKFTGDAHGNWSSFWVNSMRNWQWVQDVELDGLEYMSGTLAHNWAGWGNQVPFKSAD